MSTLIRNKPFIPASEFPSWQQQGIETRRTYDAFQNALARLGFGTNNLLEGTSYPLTRLSRNYLLLQSLYRNNWIVRKVVDSMADDMLKNWLKVVTELPPDQISRFNKIIDDTATVEKLRESMHWGRLYGGAAAVIIIKGHGKKLEKPLNLDDIQPGSYMGLLPFDRWAGITPSADINSDIDRPTDFGLPKAYKVTVDGGGSYDVHSSRVLRFIGRKLPNWERQAEVYWGESEVEVFYEELKKRDNTSWNLATLIFRANILSIRQKDLSQMLSGVGSNQQALAKFTATMRAMNDMMSNQGMLILPEEGGMEQHSYSFAGIAEVYEQFKQDICGATEYPYSRLFGRPSGGMGTTNEGDEHTYYDNVSAKQRSELDPQLKKLLPVVAMSTWGEVPKDFSWTFNPVRSLSNEEQAEMGAKKTTSIIEAYNANVITQKIAMQELKQQADESNLFSNITDDDIEKADDEFLDPMAMGEMGGEGDPLGMGPGEDEEEGDRDNESETKDKKDKKDKKKKDRGSEKKSKRGPSKNGSGEAPKTSKPRGGKDSSILARIKRAYQFGGELATIGKRHNDGSYTLDVNGKEFIADGESFDFISDSAELKLFKSDVQFQSPGTGKDHCCDCVHFDLKNASCQVVEGNIRPKDWCKEFEFGLSHVAEQLADEAGKFSKKFEKLKTFTELKPQTQAKIRSDKRQKSLLGTRHERELQEIYKKKPKAKDEDIDTERHLNFQNLDVMIENEVGSVRYHQNGKTILTHPYGYILGTLGVDGDRVDVFVGPDENALNVYVIHSKNPKTESYDEDKCMLGFASAALAKDAFIDNYGGNESFFDSMDKFSFPEFVAKLREQGKKITASDWREDEHPREQGGEGAGQFTSGSGPGSSANSENILKKRLSGQKGSNKGGIFEGADGKKRYVKFYKDPTQGKCEALANSVYRDLGIGAPSSVVFKDGDSEAVASELIKGTELRNVKLTPELARNIMKGFAADVLLKNWDAIGMDRDNILVDGDNVYRIDNGGSLLFRAQHGRKNQSSLNTLDELSNFFDPDKNPSYSRIAYKAGFTAEEIEEEFNGQLKKIDDFVKKSGGWKSYIKKTVSTLEGDDLNQVVSMLEERTRRLISDSVNDEWNESSHPRAKEGTEGGGQFVKKGEEGAAPAEKPKVPSHPPKKGYKWSNSIFSKSYTQLPQEVKSNLSEITSNSPKTEYVNTKDLIPTNEEVPTPEKSSPLGSDYVSVIKHDGKYYLWKGHQKAAMEIEQSGAEMLTAKVYESSSKAKAEEKPSYKSYAELKQEEEEHSEANSEEQSEGVSLISATEKVDVTKFLKGEENKNKVLKLYSSGKSTGAIAKQLGLPQEKATRAKLRNLLRKAGLYKELSKINFQIPDLPKTDIELKAQTHVAKTKPSDPSYTRDTVWTAFMKDTGISDDLRVKVSGLYQGWSSSSNSSSGLRMKSIAAQFYGKDILKEPLPSSASGGKSLPAYSDKQLSQAFMAAKEYAGAWVKKHGADMVYRGLNGAVAEKIKEQAKLGKTEIDISANTLSSWSTKEQFAKNWGSSGVVIKMKVRPEHVWGTYDSTPGSFSHQSEKEYVMGIPETTMKLYVNKTPEGLEYVVAGSE